MTETPPPGSPHGAFGSGDEPGLPSYPGTPPEQPGSQAPVAQAPHPQVIVLAVRLMLLGAAISLISLIYSIATLGGLKDEIRDALETSDTTVSQSTVDASFAVAIAFAIVFGAIAVVLWLWMAWKNGQGRSWARIVATVLGGFNILFTLISFAGNSATGIANIFSAVNLVLALAILVLLWRKESSAFFTERSAASSRLS